MKIRNNQSGVAHVAAILVIVVMACAGFAGWRVYYSNHKTKTSSPTQTTSTPKQTEQSKLSKYTNSELNVSLNFPAEWGEATIKASELLEFQKGGYQQLTFSKATNVIIDFVTSPYSSPLDGCGYDNPVQNAKHNLNAVKASVIGWEGSNVKRYLTGQGFNGPTVYLVNTVAGDTGAGWTKVSSKDKVLEYKDINNEKNKIVAGDDNGCSTITQAQADEANDFINFYHFAANFKNSFVYGVNAQFDARKGDNPTTRSQIVDTLNSLK